jgi:proline iminopeptidase
VCDPARFPLAGPEPGFGFWASFLTGGDASLHETGAAAALAANATPALILKGECDYIVWEVAQEYRTTLPHAVLLYLPGAGHIIYFDQPETYAGAVRAFLAGRPLPLPPYTGAMPP